MKKLLGLLAAFGMVATTSATVVACGDESSKGNDDGSKEPTVELQYDVKEALDKFKDSLEGEQSISKDFKADVKAKLKKSEISVTPKNKENKTELTPVLLNKLVTIKDVVLKEKARAEQINEGIYTITFNKTGGGYEIVTPEENMQFDAKLKVSETINLDKTALEKAIKEAEDIISKSNEVANVPVDELQKALDEAKLALSEEKDQEVVNNAEEKLSNEIQKYKDLVEAESQKDKELKEAKEKLKTEIDNANKAIEGKKDGYAKKTLKEEIEKANSVLSSSTNVEEINSVTEKLKTAISVFHTNWAMEQQQALEEAKNAGNKAIEQAKDALNQYPNKTDEAKSTLNSAIKTVEEHVGGWGDVDAIIDATKKLEDAINKYIASEDKPTEEPGEGGETDPGENPEN